MLFHINCESICQVLQNSVEIHIGNALELYINLREITVFLNLATQKHSICFHVFRSSLISFSNMKTFITFCIKGMHIFC